MTFGQLHATHINETLFYTQLVLVAVAAIAMRIATAVQARKGQALRVSA